jgi:hypothetical protein
MALVASACECGRFQDQKSRFRGPTETRMERAISVGPRCVLPESSCNLCQAWSTEDWQREYLIRAAFQAVFPDSKFFSFVTWRGGDLPSSLLIQALLERPGAGTPHAPDAVPWPLAQPWPRQPWPRLLIASHGPLG